MSELIQGGEIGTSRKDGYDFKFIILEHVRRVLILSSKEMQGGYWQTKQRVAGATVLYDYYYVEDSRDALSNAILQLDRSIHSYYDEKMKKESMAVHTILDGLKQKYKEDLEKNPKEKKELKQEYRDDRLDVINDLYASIMSFLHRKHYLELSDYTDE